MGSDRGRTGAGGLSCPQERSRQMRERGSRGVSPVSTRRRARGHRWPGGEEEPERPSPKASSRVLRCQGCQGCQGVPVARVPYWYTRAHAENDGAHPYVQRARALKSAFEHLTPMIRPGELLAMQMTKYIRGASPVPWTTNRIVAAQKRVSRLTPHLLRGHLSSSRLPAPPGSHFEASNQPFMARETSHFGHEWTDTN